ncbi:MAG: CDGSH iron-sulfur domain-containing protein [Elusimicrobia bacterium]|nr:CDGSH iron-sulfur domain-containing protein [Elusimicrobiota bacterium]
MAEKKNLKAKIKITKNGPYTVSGSVPLGKEIIISDESGVPKSWKAGEKYPDQESYVLCRCGQSKNKPFCDGAHLKNGFDGTETADKTKYSEQAQVIEGRDLILTDAQDLCAVGRFCHRGGSAWELALRSDRPESKKMAIADACDCPSGRLVAWEKGSKKRIEPNFKIQISLVEDPFRRQSGPLWVKGGIPVQSEDGTLYEIRNRVTLCRCGQSKNKPFCDGTHCEINFQDGHKF